jgi:hypothetical protein
MTVERAIEILRDAMWRSGEQRVDTEPVRLALRCLWSHGPVRWPLVTYWEAAGQTDEIVRSEGTTAGFDAIVSQLRKSGVYRDTSA